MNLANLKKEIKFKWRVQSFSKNKPVASCVGYITARDVMDLLDDVCGPENWQDDYKEANGKLFAGIAIRQPQINDGWVWKWDTGSESNIEKDKGHVSDAFKRAAVKWGIGRFLYGMKIQYIKANQVHEPFGKCKARCGCYPVDDAGKRIWDVTAHVNRGNSPQSTDKPPLQHFKESFGGWTKLSVIKIVNQGGWTLKKGISKKDKPYWLLTDSTGDGGFIKEMTYEYLEGLPKGEKVNDIPLTK